MIVQFSPEFEKNLSVIVEYYRQEDVLCGTFLLNDFKADLLNSIEMVKDFPEAFPEVIPRIRRIILKKFKKHCIRYSYNKKKKMLSFLTIHHYSQNY